MWGGGKELRIDEGGKKLLRIYGMKNYFEEIRNKICFSNIKPLPLIEENDCVLPSLPHWDHARAG